MSTDNYLTAGKIISTHGLRGEVKIYPATDSPDDFKGLKEVVLRKGAKESRHRLERVSRFKNVIIARLSEIGDIDEAKLYVNAEVLIERDQLKPLSDNCYYEADLIGMAVSDERYGELGRLNEVIHTGANDVYSIGLSGGGELLLPAIRDCILKVDVENKAMEVHVLDGLMPKKD